MIIYQNLANLQKDAHLALCLHPPAETLGF